MSTIRARTAWRTRARNLSGAAIGNLLESYDWQCYLVLSATIAPQFFSKEDPVSNLLGILVIFAVGFVFRPIGGLVFGFLSDLHGRRAGLSLSMVLMGSGSLLIGLSPTFSQVGVLAPTLLLIARSLQGVSAGGEFAAASSYVVELAPPGRRSSYSSSIYVTATLGVLLAALTFAGLRFFLTAAEVARWGWRIPFLVGALLAFYGFYLRSGVNESAEFLAKGASGTRLSVLGVIHAHPRPTLRVMGLTAGATVVFYTFIVYLPSYAARVHRVPQDVATWVMVGALMIFTLALPLWGIFADRFGARTSMMIFAGGVTLTSPVLFGLLGSSWISLFVVLTVALLLFAACAAVLPQLLAEQFPVNIRTIGVGLPYSLTVAMFGGTAPYVVEMLTAADLSAWFPWYVSTLCLVSVISAIRSRSADAEKDFDESLA